MFTPGQLKKCTAPKSTKRPLLRVSEEGAFFGIRCRGAQHHSRLWGLFLLGGVYPSGKAGGALSAAGFSAGAAVSALG